MDSSLQCLRAFAVHPAYLEANNSLMAGTGIGGSAVVCAHALPKWHAIQNSAETSSRNASKVTQCWSFRTFRARRFVFMPPL